jgi:hypothetical protein
METTRFQFPIAHMHKPHEFLPELKKPITLTLDDIRKDMNQYVRQFPKEILPHITETQEIVDNIHNYKLRMPSKNKEHALMKHTSISIDSVVE